MLEEFRCPDGEIVKVGMCLSKCRMQERCMTLPTLALISREREWAGIASTTQLINGTMMEFLKLTKPYCVDPQSRAFMLSGTWHHGGLEDIAKELGLAAEVALTSGDRDIFDLLEKEDNGLVLTDYKLWGSFKVAKALGLTKQGMKPDPSGEVYKTTSKWGVKGAPKMVPVFAIVPENIDMWEVEYQLNRYKVKLEDMGIKVNRLQVQATVRDGGLAIATSRGIDRNIYRIPVKVLSREDVEGYFKFKNDNLMKALEQGSWDMPCTQAETWDGVRCQGYCDLAKYCPKGQLVNRLESLEEIA